MNRGEIWLIRLSPTEGAEISKTRPALIVSDDSVGTLPLKVIVPITSWKAHYRGVAWLIKIIPNATDGLSKPSAADAFQVRSVSQTRFTTRLGTLSDSEMLAVEQALSAVLCL